MEPERGSGAKVQNSQSVNYCGVCELINLHVTAADVALKKSADATRQTEIYLCFKGHVSDRVTGYGKGLRKASSKRLRSKSRQGSSRTGVKSKKGISPYLFGYQRRRVC